MAELLAILTPILVVDFINPILLGLLVSAAASARPVANSAAMLIGHTLVYFVAGIGIAHGLDAITDWLIDYWNNAPPLSFALSIVLGIVCFYWALRPPKAGSQRAEPTWELTPLRCLSYGIVVAGLGAPFALPYIAAIDQILKAELSFGASYAVLTAYNIGYALPFAVVPIAVVARGEEARPFLDRFNALVLAAVTKIMPWLIALIGAWLVFDGVYYFVVGKAVI